MNPRGLMIARTLVRSKLARKPDAIRSGCRGSSGLRKAFGLLPLHLSSGLTRAARIDRTRSNIVVHQSAPHGHRVGYSLPLPMNSRMLTILVLSEDLLVIPQFEDTARGLGFSVVAIESPASIGADIPVETRRIQLTEPLTGADARFIRVLVDLQPALIIVDLNSKRIPWERWIHTIKTSSATRRIPVVAFGPHVESELLDRAQSAGANAVLARGGLIKSLPRVIQQWVRIADGAELEKACARKLSELGRRGLELIQQGRYYEAHEALESAWQESFEEEGYLYRSLLQVAVAYHHLERGNFAGAAKMLLRVRQWIRPLPDVCCGVDVQALRAQIRDLDAGLEVVGSENAGGFDRLLLRPIPVIAT